HEAGPRLARRRSGSRGARLITGRHGPLHRCGWRRSGIGGRRRLEGAVAAIAKAASLARLGLIDRNHGKRHSDASEETSKPETPGSKHEQWPMIEDELTRPYRGNRRGFLGGAMTIISKASRD